MSQEGLFALRAALCAVPKTAPDQGLVSESKIPQSNRGIQSNSVDNSEIEAPPSTADVVANTSVIEDCGAREHKSAEPSMPEGPDDRSISKSRQICSEDALSSEQPNIDSSNMPMVESRNNHSEQAVAVYSGSSDLMPMGAQVPLLLAISPFLRGRPQISCL